MSLWTSLVRCLSRPLQARGNAGSRRRPYVALSVERLEDRLVLSGFNDSLTPLHSSVSALAVGDASAYQVLEQAGAPNSLHVSAAEADASASVDASWNNKASGHVEFRLNNSVVGYAEASWKYSFSAAEAGYFVLTGYVPIDGFRFSSNIGSTAIGAGGAVWENYRFEAGTEVSAELFVDSYSRYSGAQIPIKQGSFNWRIAGASDIALGSVTRDDASHVFVQYAVIEQDLRTGFDIGLYESHYLGLSPDDRFKSSYWVDSGSLDYDGRIATALGTHRIRIPATLTPESWEYLIAIADDGNRIPEPFEGNNQSELAQIARFGRWSSGFVVQTAQTGTNIVLLIRGYDNPFDAQELNDANDFAIREPDKTVIAVRWDEAAIPDVDWRLRYDVAALNTRLVGQEIANSLRWVDPKTIEILGHSLGAQVAGFVGQFLGGIGRIVAADPAGPQFEGKGKDDRLDPTDADLVVVIHTTRSLGDQNRIGDVDQYVSGVFDGVFGLFTDPGAAHRRAWTLLMDSVRDKNMRTSIDRFGFGYNASDEALGEHQHWVSGGSRIRFGDSIRDKLSERLLNLLTAAFASRARRIWEQRFLAPEDPGEPIPS